MSEELKPCPFCGMDEPEWCDEENRQGTWHYAQCRSVSCQAQGPRELEKSAAFAAWNRRDSRLSRVEEALGEAVKMVGELRIALKPFADAFANPTEASKNISLHDLRVACETHCSTPITRIRALQGDGKTEKGEGA